MSGRDDKSSLSQYQGMLEGELADASERVWGTPRYPDEVEEALRNNVPKRGLVVGCGVDEAAQYVGSGAAIVGIDLNANAIAAATAQYSHPNISYIQGDICDESVANGFEPESFGCVVMTGVITNLITEDDLRRTFRQINRLLSPGGRVVVSDYLLFQATGGGWDWRYRRDLMALIDTNLVGPDGELPPYGTIVARPFGRSIADTQFLTSDDIAAALLFGQFERFARHWHPKMLMRCINEGSEAWLQVVDASVEPRHYDADLELGDHGWLTGLRLILEKKRTVRPHEQLVVEGLLEKASAVANAEGDSYQAFFDVLVDD